MSLLLFLPIWSRPAVNVHQSIGAPRLLAGEGCQPTPSSPQPAGRCSSVHDISNESSLARHRKRWPRATKLPFLSNKSAAATKISCLFAPPRPSSVPEPPERTKRQSPRNCGGLGGGEGLRLHTRFACFTPSSLSKGGREARREGHFPPQDNKRNSWCLLTPLTRNRDDVSASLPRWPGQAPTWAGETPPAASASMEAARPQTAAPQQRRKKKKKHGRTPQDGKCAQHRALRVLLQVCRTRRNQASTRGLGEDEETLTVLLLSSHPRFCSTTACCPVH